jgi:hypothetical protein
VPKARPGATRTYILAYAPFKSWLFEQSVLVIGLGQGLKLAKVKKVVSVGPLCPLARN